MNIKRTTSVLMVALFVVSSILMGCTTPTEAPPVEETPAAPKPEEKVTLTLIHPWAGDEWDQFAPVVEAAEKALGIKIEPKVLRSDDLITQLSTQWAAGTAPGDVIFLTVPSLIKKGAADGHVMEVTDLVNPADFSPGAVDFNTVGGKIYGVPYCEGVKPGFWYRKSFFEKHGLSEPATKEEFVALLEQIQGIEGIKAPIGSGDGDGWPLSDAMEHFLVAYEGPELLTELSTCTCPGSWDKVEGVFVNDFAPLVEAGHFSEPIEWTTAMEMWWNGDYALYFMGNWLTAMVDDPDDLGLIPIPGTQGVAGAIDFLFVSTYTEHPEEAKALLAWLATTGQEVRASQGGTVATYLAVSPDAYPPAEKMMADAIAEMTPLFDLDDSIGGKFQTTFWDQLKLLWVSPDRAAEVVDVIHESYNEACGCGVPAAEKVTLSLIHPWAGEEWDQFAPVVDAAEKALGIEIEPKVLRSDDLITQLSTQWAAGTAPGDVIFLTVPSLIKKGAADGHVMEVTDLVNPADFSPGAVDFNTVGGKIYGVPYCEGVKPGFWYRKSFFEKHGLSEPATKDEFVALLEQIQGIEGIKAPIGSGDGDGWPLSDAMEHFLVAYEGPELLAELSTCTCPGSWDKVEGVFVNDFAPLVEAGYFSEPIEWTTAMEMWWNGDFALYFMGNWLTAMVDDPDDLGLIPIPGTQGVAGAIDFLFVSTYTEHPEEAKALLAWLATTGQEVRASQGGTVATYLAVSPDAYPPAEKMMADAIAEMTPLFDLDDSIGGKFQTTFWDQLKLLWVSPDRAAEVVEIIHESYNDACGCK